MPRKPDFSKDHGKDEHGYCCSVCGELAPTRAEYEENENFYVRIFTGRITGTSTTICVGCWQTGAEIDRDGNEQWIDP